MITFKNIYVLKIINVQMKQGKLEPTGKMKKVK